MYHAGVARLLGLFGKGVYDFVYVLLAQAVFCAVFDEALGGINHKYAFAGAGVFFV